MKGGKECDLELRPHAKMVAFPLQMLADCSEQNRREGKAAGVQIS
ncbi:hypothetical protein GKA01_14100 [Gluconobacter kanchanaburiensis NBRC 103587]|uniref:Uncharacterized protein n=1 Tax=Gluconobacter kanchanaburiensis NBRC 103587 TaxID=1307948 RepID=A0A511B956_9PROT|nr:hypothetical protein AA103587_1258 [Gluconobacter kanchanaburiensis NBRC 103587]GEK96213.1 hypothetical protein GKA01_14100 [Gluconobacter kanchanaburiensis NBRC 103587]